MPLSTSALRRLHVGVLALTVALAATTCGEPTAPQVGTWYGLKSIDSRRPPTWRSKEPPTDSTFSAFFYDEYHIISDSEVVHNLWVGFGHLNPDSTVGYSLSGCWKGYHFRYRTSRDTLYLTSELPYPLTPPTPLFLVAKGPGLIVDSLVSDDGLTYRYIPAQRSTRSCG